jgi:hypothetical protein
MDEKFAKSLILEYIYPEPESHVAPQWDTPGLPPRRRRFQKISGQKDHKKDEVYTNFGNFKGAITQDCVCIGQNLKISKDIAKS